MKSLLFIIMFLNLCACSSMIKMKHNKYFKVKIISDINAHHILDDISYTDSLRDGENCFQTNFGNKETITVHEDYKEFALNHFYKRISKINVTVLRRDSEVVRTTVIATDSLDFDLEIAHCYLTFNFVPPSHTGVNTYVSFRLADKKEEHGKK